MARNRRSKVTNAAAIDQQEAEEGPAAATATAAAGVRKAKTAKKAKRGYLEGGG